MSEARRHMLFGGVLCLPVLSPQNEGPCTAEWGSPVAVIARQRPVQAALHLPTTGFSLPF